MKSTHHRAHRRGAGAGVFLRDAVFGANDGIVTTFAVVAGASGAHLSPTVIVILGFANLVADGISMGLGEYLGSKSEQQFYRGQRAREIRELRLEPQQEEQEVRKVFRSWGFRGERLERSIAVLKRHPKAWVDIMLNYELGIGDGKERTPARSGMVMFFAFVLAGFVPLLPILFGADRPFPFAVVLTIVALFTVGAVRVSFIPTRWWRAGLEMLVVGAVAAASAYAVGALLGALLAPSPLV